MEKTIQLIKNQILECHNTGDMFRLPLIEGVEIHKESLKGDGSTLYHDVYEINIPDKGTIHIDYRSKDRCRSFQVRPDRSYIVVNCSNSELDFSDAWDENS